MNDGLQKYKNYVKNKVNSFEYNGENQYFCLPSIFDVDLMAIMRNEELKQNDKILNILCSIICDENGFKIFDIENEEHKQIVKNLPADLQGEFFNKFSEIYLDPIKKK